MQSPKQALYFLMIEESFWAGRRCALYVPAQMASQIILKDSAVLGLMMLVIRFSIRFSACRLFYWFSFLSILVVWAKFSWYFFDLM